MSTNNIYSGKDNLSIMDNAKNYNNHLVSKIVQNIETDCQTIMDFGAGNGHLAEMVNKAVNKKIICVENADNLAEYYNPLQKDLTLIKSLEEIADNSIDFIYSSNVLEHIENDKEIVSILCNKLKKNGKIFIYVPAFNVLYSDMDKQVGHYRRYTKHTLRQLFDTKQLKITDIRYADFCGYFVTLLYKFIPHKNGAFNKTSLKIFDTVIFPFSCLFDAITRGKCCGKNVMLVATKIEEK